MALPVLNPRITWQAAKDGGMTGVVVGESRGYKARTVVFQLFFRPQCSREAPYVLNHRLPFQQLKRAFPTVVDAQTHAERYLCMAAELLGFSAVDAAELARLREVEARMKGLEK
jgi:hypothetical protein